MFEWLSTEFPKAPIPTQLASVDKIVSDGPPALKRILSSVPKYEKLNNLKSEQLLGIKYHSIKECLLRMVRDMVKLGLIGTG